MNYTTVPLIVDVDGTLIRSDLLWEGFARVLLRHPTRLPVVAGALFRGKAAFKAALAEASQVEVDHVPVEPATIALIAAARAQGRPVVLASAAYYKQLSTLAQRLGAEDAWGSSDTNNLKGARKLERIRLQYSSFDYVGNSSADVPLWGAARRAFAVNPSAGTLRRARRLRPDLELVRARTSAWREWLRAIRPHQWAKNTLLFLPALAAHLVWSPALVVTLLAGFVAFSALASAVYLINDLADLSNDRVHPTKRDRPIASGALPIPQALGAAVGLVVAAALVATRLPYAFQVILAGYLILTTAYSLDLKKRAILDVISLATLYATRVIAGAALVEVPLSRWFLAFSVFFFFSLALVKRVVELQNRPPEEDGRVAGRGYHGADAPMLTSLGTTAVGASSLIYCLYITSTEVTALYNRPDVLWLGLPLLLYWQARVWLLTGRDQMHEDPVVFALKDRVSRVMLFGFLLILLGAA